MKYVLCFWLMCSIPIVAQVNIEAYRNQLQDQSGQAIEFTGSTQQGAENSQTFFIQYNTRFQRPFPIKLGLSTSVILLT